MLDLLNIILTPSKVFNGLATIALHIGGRYVTAEVPKNMDGIFNQPIFRRIFVFFVAYIAFRDLKYAVLSTLIFILLFNYLLNEESMIYYQKIFGTYQGKLEEKVTPEMYQQAKTVLETYNKQNAV